MKKTSNVPPAKGRKRLKINATRTKGVGNVNPNSFYGTMGGRKTEERIEAVQLPELSFLKKDKPA